MRRQKATPSADRAFPQNENLAYISKKGILFRQPLIRKQSTATAAHKLVRHRRTRASASVLLRKTANGTKRENVLFAHNCGILARITQSSSSLGCLVVNKNPLFYGCKQFRPAGIACGAKSLFSYSELPKGSFLFFAVSSKALFLAQG